MNLKDKIADYPNFPKKGILFRDFSPILGDPSALSFMIEEFQRNFILMMSMSLPELNLEDSS